MRGAACYAPAVAPLLLAFVTVLAGCADPPQPLPTQAAAARVDRSALPPLYRSLYDYSFLPAAQQDEQRVRILIWLRHMDFNRYQLARLEELAATFAKEREELAAAHDAVVQRHAPAVQQVYAQLWEALRAGASEEELAGIAERLDGVRARESDLLALRSRSIRTLLDLEEPFLRTLTPQQEALMADATFLLRHRLDPYANPGDFTTLVGSVYNAGEFGALTRPTFDPNEDHLNLGGLWSADAETRETAYFPDARREAVLYMVLLEPALPEAIAAARALRASSGPEQGELAGAAPVPAPGQAPPPPGSPAQTPAGTAPGADPSAIRSAGAGATPTPGPNAAPPGAPGGLPGPDGSPTVPDAAPPP